MVQLLKAFEVHIQNLFRCSNHRTAYKFKLERYMFRLNVQVFDAMAERFHESLLWSMLVRKQV